MAAVVWLLEVAEPGALVHAEPLSVLSSHWYDSGIVPAAVTEKAAVVPAVTVIDDGCTVIIGGLDEGGAGDDEAPPPPHPVSIKSIKPSAMTKCRKRYSPKLTLQTILNPDIACC